MLSAAPTEVEQRTRGPCPHLPKECICDLLHGRNVPLGSQAVRPLSPAAPGPGRDSSSGPLPAGAACFPLPGAPSPQKPQGLAALNNPCRARASPAPAAPSLAPSFSAASTRPIGAAAGGVYPQVGLSPGKQVGAPRFEAVPVPTGAARGGVCVFTTHLPRGCAACTSAAPLTVPKPCPHGPRGTVPVTPDALSLQPPSSVPVTPEALSPRLPAGSRCPPTRPVPIPPSVHCTHSVMWGHCFPCARDPRGSRGRGHRSRNKALKYKAATVVTGGLSAEAAAEAMTLEQGTSRATGAGGRQAAGERALGPGWPPTHGQAGRGSGRCPAGLPLGSGLRLGLGKLCAGWFGRRSTCGVRQGAGWPARELESSQRAQRLDKEGGGAQGAGTGKSLQPRPGSWPGASSRGTAESAKVIAPARAVR